MSWLEGSCPHSQGPAGGPRAMEGQWFLHGMGWGSEGSHWGCWIHLFSLCGVQRCLTKEACGGQNPACAPFSKGTCFSKDASCPSLVGLTCHHCTARRVLESRSPQPGMCLPRNHGKKPLEWVPSTHLQQLEGETAYSDRLEQTNEFPDCSILLPGP